MRGVAGEDAAGRVLCSAALAALFTDWLCLLHAKTAQKVATEAGFEDARKPQRMLFLLKRWPPCTGFISGWRVRH